MKLRESLDSVPQDILQQFTWMKALAHTVKLLGVVSVATAASQTPKALKFEKPCSILQPSVEEVTQPWLGP